MRKIALLTLAYFVFVLSSLAQVGIGTTNPDPSAELDISATNKGILIPRVSLNNVSNTLTPINNPVDGLMVYNTNPAVIGGDGKGFYFFNNTTWEKIITTSSQDGTGTDNQNITGSALIGNVLNIGIENGTGQNINLSSLKDKDWLEAGNTEPNDINDNIYTMGKVKIGLPVFLPSDGMFTVISDQSIGVNITNNNSGTSSGMIVNLPTANATIKTGIEVLLSGTANSIAFTSNGMKISDNLIGNQNRRGLSQTFKGTNNSLTSNTVALYNTFTNTSSYDGAITGLYNDISSNSNGRHYGVDNTLNGSGSGIQYGVINNMSNSGDGRHYGIYNNITGTGSGNKYGTYTQIQTTVNGIHYGVYSDVQKNTGYAGYFIGRLSLGNSTSNRYLMPSADGTSNQILTTDGLGQLSFVNASTLFTNTDDQTLSITDNQISIEDGNTIAIKEIADADLNTKIEVEKAVNNNEIQFYIEGVTTAGSDGIITFRKNNYTDLMIEVNNFSRNLFMGEKSGEKVHTGQYPLGWENTFYGYRSGAEMDTGAHNLFMGTHAGEIATGSFNVFLGPGTGRGQFTPNSGDENVFVGAYSGNKNTTGNNNTFLGRLSGLANSTASNNVAVGFSALLNNSGGGNNVAIGYNAGRGAGNGSHTKTGGVFIGYEAGKEEMTDNKLYIDNSATTTPLLYGEFDIDLLRINGTLQVNDPSATGYGFPVSDGAAGQVLATNGGGSLSFVAQTTNTDNQTADVFNLNGTDLELSLSNDGQPTNTVDLSSLANTDNQTADVFNLNGTDLELSLSNDGQPTNTVDLSSLTNTDNQTIDTFNLSGTTLHLSLSNDGQPDQTVNLASLTDADWYETGNTAPNSINDNIFTQGRVGIKDTSPNTALEINGGLTLKPKSPILVLTANTAYAVGDTSVILVENTSGTTWRLSLSGGLAPGQLLYIVGTNNSTTDIRLWDIGNLALTAARNVNKNDALSLLWNGTKWVEISYSNN
jgi:hypothetical protein